MVADGEERDAKKRVCLFFGSLRRGLAFFFSFGGARELLAAVFAKPETEILLLVVAFLRGRHGGVWRVFGVGVALGVPPVVGVYVVGAGARRRRRGERGDAPLSRLERSLERERRARKQFSRFQGLGDPRRAHDRRMVPIRLLQRRQFGRRQARANDVRHGDARVVVREATAVRQHDILQVDPRRVRDAVDVDAHAVKHATGRTRVVR